MDILRDSWETPLCYAPRSRLNLKLFAFFGASKLDTRHPTHRSKLENLDENLREKIRTDNGDPDEIIKTLENLFLGFHGEGLQRTWCAQSFLPVCKELLSCEAIWKTKKTQNLSTWQDALKQFSFTQHLFLARSGEVLYLQLCNALRQKTEDIQDWLNRTGLNSFLTKDEQDPKVLHKLLNSSLESILNDAPPTFSKLADYIDTKLDGCETVDYSDYKGNERRYTDCGWCPEETWQEGYLFAVELSRICKAHLDLIDRIELLETTCALQVLRTLVWQSSRYCRYHGSNTNINYKIAISYPEVENRIVKQISRATVKAIEKQIYNALRDSEIKNSLSNTSDKKPEQHYAEADKKYGHKLFRTLSKRLGFIIPSRGSGMRFILNDRLLRCLMVTLLPARRISYDTFKKTAEAHYGFVFDERGFCKANEWSTGVHTESLEGVSDEWLVKMLEESGSLKRLSDSCSLVENNAFDEQGEEKV
jgi:hypothetical protein